MKHYLSITSLIAVILLGNATFSTPVHASILNTSRINIFQNRDDRNQLLEEIKKPQPQPLTYEERQAILIQELSVSLSNYQNIYSRIASSTLEATNNGQDTSDIDALLSNASSTMDEASSTISSLIVNSNPDGARAATALAIHDLNSTKETLQQAIDTLKKQVI